MAYVPKYKNDVFISFALADNVRPSPDARGWVTRFADDLKVALGCWGITEELNFFFSKPDGHYQLHQFAEDARDAAILVAVASPGYVAPRAEGRKSFGIQEFEAFVETDPTGERVFIASPLPYLFYEGLPPLLKNKVPIDFWSKSDGTPMRLSPTTPQKQDIYEQRINDLARSISQRLIALRAAAAAGGAPAFPTPTIVVPPTASAQAPAAAPAQTVAVSPAPAAAPPRAPAPQAPKAVPVLLARATDDLAEEREQVRRYLEQYGVLVLPPSNEYPPTQAEFEAGFAALLSSKQAPLFVQLLSKDAGEHPHGHAQLQARMAAQAKLPVLQWRHPQLDVDAIADETQKTLLNGATVMADSLETFKSRIVSTAEELAKPKPDAPAERPPQDGKMVFINYFPSDEAIADIIKRAVERHGHFPFKPAALVSPAEIRKDLENGIVNCDALFVVYGMATPVWVQEQVMLYGRAKKTRLKERGEEMHIVAVYDGPPPGKAKVAIPYKEVTTLDPSELDAKLEELSR